MENNEKNSPVVPVENVNTENQPAVVPANENITPVKTEEEHLQEVEAQKSVIPVQTAENVVPIVDQNEVQTPVMPSGEEVVQRPPQEEKQEVKPIEEKPQSNSNQDDNKGPSGFAKFMTVLLFIFFFALVYFLPEITDYINLQKSLRNQQEITTGRLVCKNTKDTDTLDVKIEATFDFTDSKMMRLTHITTASGDKIKDKEELEQLRNDCSVLKNEVSSYDGISVICSLNNGINVVKQTLNYEMIKKEEIQSSYAEAGGIYIDFNYLDDIKNVESKMISSGYSCEKLNY